MDPRSLQSLGAAGWGLAWRQHWAISRAQLLDLGLGAEAIRHRLADGRLHRWRWRGVYAVGRPELSEHGCWMAALLACGHQAVLSHESAAALWGVIPYRPGPTDVSLPLHLVRDRPGIRAHRRVRALAEHLASRDRIPVTDIACTLVDLSARVHRTTLETAVNEADKLDLIDPWPDLGLVVETDGLRYHRTAAQQERDRVRDQAHIAAGLTPLRFTHGQVRFEPLHVEDTLRSVADVAA